MSKNLLNESQVRQFMKLASLQPLASGFVEGLTKAADAKELEELRTGRTGALGPKGGSHNPGHGRGQGESADGSLFQEDEESELHATEDELGAEDHFADEEADELDFPGPEETPGRTISVDDFLEALESALETVMDDEVEVTEEPPGAELEADVELDGGGEELELGVEEDPLQESAFGAPPSAAGAANNHKGSTQHSDHKVKKVGDAGLASQGPGLVKEEDEDELEEGTKKDEDLKDDEPGGRGEKKGDKADINETNDELVEQITKRVAARILKSALRKK